MFQFVKCEAIFNRKKKCCYYSPSFEDFSILTWESNDFKLKTMGSLLIAHNLSLFLTRQIPLYLYSYFNITSVVIIYMFYRIIRCPSISLCICNCCLFSFHCCVTSFVFYQKQNVRAL